jgi:endonuclease III related protein
MTLNKKTRRDLLNIYNLLYKRFGPLEWWPGDSPFEVMVGAILTQNTAWTNVEKAIGALKKENALCPQTIVKMDVRRLRRLVRPSGYFNQKADRLKIFSRYFLAPPYKGSVSKMAQINLSELRDELLQIKGIGPETADSILLYALSKPIFVVDAYTRRVFSRLGYLPVDVDYQATQEFFMGHLPKDMKLYNEYHAQIVYLGKDFCKPKPKCQDCPLYPLDKCGAFLE